MRHPQGIVEIDEAPNGRRRITVLPDEPALFLPWRSCETAYPWDLIRAVLDVKGLAYLCDEILRDESPGYVRAFLERALLAYLEPGWFKGRRILDFGCGAGASTMCLARLFPDAAVVGIEVDERLLGLARRRVQHYQFPNVTLVRSPSPMELPPDLGGFDGVVMSAVYEHLLPHERAQVLPLLWSVIKPGGFLFLNQTPYRYFPYESHTTGLPFINYLPDRLALAFARACSKRVRRGESWENLLRYGIRGATEGEILCILSRDSGHRPILLEPCRDGLRDRIDLWYSALSPNRYRRTKRLVKHVLATLRSLSGVTLVPELSLVIHKEETGTTPARAPSPAGRGSREDSGVPLAHVVEYSGL